MESDIDLTRSTVRENFARQVEDVQLPAGDKRIQDSTLLQKGYIVVRALGRGAFGEVFLVKRTEGRGWVAAVKKIKCRRTVDADRAYEEVRTLQNASHRSVLQLRSSFVDHRNNVVYLVTEYCEQGSLNESLQNGLIPWSVRMEWFEQLLQGLVYLHDRVRVAHRDLKPDNILVTKSNDIKIADFGLAKKLEMISFGTQYHPPTEIENAQQEMTAYMLSHCGTKSFMAPEVFRNHYTKKADIFSLALIFILIAERKWVYSSGRYFYAVMVRHNNTTTTLGHAMYLRSHMRTQDVQLLTDSITFNTATYDEISLIKRMLHPSYHSRLSASDVLTELQRLKRAGESNASGYYAFLIGNPINRLSHLFFGGN